MENSERPEQIVSPLAAKKSLILLARKKPKLNVIFVNNPQLDPLYQRISHWVELGFGYLSSANNVLKVEVIIFSPEEGKEEEILLWRILNGLNKLYHHYPIRRLLILLARKKPKLNVIFVNNPQLDPLYQGISHCLTLGFGYLSSANNVLEVEVIIFSPEEVLPGVNFSVAIQLG